MAKSRQSSQSFAAIKPAPNGRGLLAQFVRQMLFEKGLTASDVERLSEGQISDSYVAAIAQGKIQNLTLKKLKALALGLGVNRHLLIALASGIRQTGNSHDEAPLLRGLCDDYAMLENEERTEVDLVIAMLHREIQRRLLSGEH